MRAQHTSRQMPASFIRVKLVWESSMLAQCWGPGAGTRMNACAKAMTVTEFFFLQDFTRRRCM